MAESERCGLNRCDMTIHKILSTLFLLSLLACSGAVTQAQAQALGLTPAMMDAKVRRGGTYTVDFTLHNGSNTRVRARCSASDYWYGEDNRRVTGRPGTLPRSASLWTQFTPAEVLIEPQGSATVRAVITVPRTASGSYYTSPTFETEAADAPTPQPPGTTRANIKVRFQGLLLLTTEDGAEYNVEVMGGKVLPPTASSPLEMALDVRNRGTAHARLRAIFALLDEAGKLAGRGRVEEKRYLPGQRDDLRASWAGELAPGRYTAMVTLTYDRAGMEPATLVYELPFEVRKQ